MCIWIGLSFFGFYWSLTKAYQIYDASRLSLVYTSEVPLTYILQKSILSVGEFWLAYLGAFVIVTAVICVGYESIIRAQSKPNSEELESEPSSEFDNGFDYSQATDVDADDRRSSPNSSKDVAKR